MADRITKFGALLKAEKGVILLDDDRDGRVDGGEGAVVTRCGERFLVVAEKLEGEAGSDSYLELNPKRTLHIPNNNLRLPYDLQISRGETMASLQEKLRAASPLGASAAACPFLAPTLPSDFNKDFRSHEVFGKAASLIPQELPHVVEQGRFTALYPASGAHIAPLATFFGLIDQGVIDSGELIMTEIESSFAQKLKENLEALKATGIIEEYRDLGEKRFDGFPKSSLRSFELTYKGKSVSIQLAVNMCGKKYYREEYFAEADAIFLHDVDAKWESYSRLISKIFQDRKKSSKPQIVLLDNEMDSPTGLHRNQDLTFLNHVSIDGGYGHYGPYVKLRNYSDPNYDKLVEPYKEKGTPLYHSALLLRADQPLLAGLSESETELAIRLASLGTSDGDGDIRFPAGLNHDECTESSLRVLGTDNDFYIQGESFLELARIVERWLQLPEVVFPPLRKDQIALKFLFYIYSAPGWALPGEWEKFYQSHRLLFAAEADAVRRHPKEFKKLGGRAKKEVAQLLAGHSPSSDFRYYSSNNTLLEAIQRTNLGVIKKAESPPSTSQTVANPETAVRR